MRTQLVFASSLLVLLTTSALGAMPLPFAFLKSTAVKPYSQDQKLADMTDPPVRAASANSAFGQSVAVSPDQTTLVVGSPYEALDANGINYNSAGAVYVYVKSGGAWTLQQEIFADARWAASQFSASVAIDGDTIVVGSPGDPVDDTGNNYSSYAGSAFVFTRSGTTWTQQQKLIASGTNERSNYNWFGGSVAISGNTIVVGSEDPYDQNGDNVIYGAGAAYVFTRSGSTWTQQQKLVGQGTNGRSSYAQFASSVAIDTDTVVIGAFQDTYDANGDNSNYQTGSVWVFTRSASVWSLQQRITETGTNAREQYDNFGTSVSVSGDTFVAGSFNGYDASGDNYVYNNGTAWIYTRSGSTWTLQQRLVETGTSARLGSDKFGNSVSISGNTAIVGAPAYSYDSSGANYLFDPGGAFVFTRSGSTWTRQQTLVGTGTNGRIANDAYGTSVAVAGDTAIAGAADQSYDSNGANYAKNSGAAYVEERSGSTWTQTKKLADATDPPLRTFAASEKFGAQLALSEDESTLVVGLPNYSMDSSGANYLYETGVVFIYVKSGGTWTLQQGLDDPNRDLQDYFGQSVAISGDTILVGTPGNFYDATESNYSYQAGAVFAFTRSGTTWSFQQKIVASGTNERLGQERFGASVALTGNDAIIGSYGGSYDASGDNYSNQAGAAYIYTRSGSTWSLQQKLVATGTNGREDNDSFGYSVAISGNTVVAGAPYHGYDQTGDNFASQAGAAWVFTRSGSTWSPQQKIVATGTNARNSTDYFGTSSAIDTDTAVFGAPNHGYDASGINNIGLNGAAFVYTRTGSTWSLQQKLVGFGTNGIENNDQFGTSVSISGNVFVAGTPNQAYDDSGGNQGGGAGAAYLFTRTGSTWASTQKIVASGINARENSNNFGVCVLIVNKTVVSGSSWDAYDINGANYQTGAGAAYIFTKKP